MPLTIFPSSLDAFTNPASGDYLDSSVVPHHIQHGQVNDAIAAIEAKLGVDSSAVTTSLDYLIKNASSVDPGHVHTKLLNNGHSAILSSAGKLAFDGDASANLYLSSAAVLKTDGSFIVGGTYFQLGSAATSFSSAYFSSAFSSTVSGAVTVGLLSTQLSLNSPVNSAASFYGIASQPGTTGTNVNYTGTTRSFWTSFLHRTNGVVASWIGYDVQGITFSASGTATSVSGIGVQNMGNASVVTSYALNIASQSGSSTATYGIYFAGTGAANGINWGDTSTVLYSTGSGALSMTGALTVSSNITATSGQIIAPTTGSSGGLVLGGDVQLYRNSASVLRVTGSLILNTATLSIGSTSTTYNVTIASTASTRTFGVAASSASAVGGALQLNGGASGAGTDLTGGDLVLRSGLGTGTGGSAIQFWVGLAGSTGSTTNTITQVGTFSKAGQFQLPLTGSAAGLLIGGDFQLYRTAANQARTPHTLIIDTQLLVGVTSGTNMMEVGGVIRADVTGTSVQFQLYAQNSQAAASGVGAALGFLGPSAVSIAYITGRWDGSATTDGHLEFWCRRANAPTLAMTLSASGALTVAGLGTGVVQSTAGLLSTTNQSSLLSAGAGIGISGTTPATIRAKRTATITFMGGGFTPAASGLDKGIWRVPNSASDGTTVLTWNVRELYLRCETRGASGSVLNISRYTGTGAWSGANMMPSGGISLQGLAGTVFETTVGVAAFTTTQVSSGDKLRPNVTYLDVGDQEFLFELTLEEV